MVAWSKMSLPSPTTLRTLVNVSSRFRARLDELVVDSGQMQERVAELVDMFGGDPGGTTSRFDHGRCLRGHLPWLPASRRSRGGTRARARRSAGQHQRTRRSCSRGPGRIPVTCASNRLPAVAERL